MINMDSNPPRLYSMCFRDIGLETQLFGMPSPWKQYYLLLSLVFGTWNTTSYMIGLWATVSANHAVDVGICSVGHKYLGAGLTRGARKEAVVQVEWTLDI